MMQLLMPLGLLGLLGVIALIIIYILKPNYQQKIVSSTYVWKLSLRYRRRQIPINRLLSLLILLCQILIVTACAMILARPFIPSDDVASDSERVVIIDASADMLASHNGATRFERAVEQAYSYAGEALMQPDGLVSVILAGGEAEMLVRRADPSRRAEVLETIDGLLGDDTQASRCSYMQADVEGAMRLAEEIAQINPEAQIVYYTATKYADPGPVTIVDVSEEGEWNIGVLDADVALEENYYTITTDVAAYGRGISVIVSCSINQANGDVNNTFTLESPAISLTDGVPQKVVFRTRPAAEEENIQGGISQEGDTLVIWSTKTFVYSYQRVSVSVRPSSGSGVDDFGYDDRIELYGGSPETFRIQYASSTFNSFFNDVFLVLRQLKSLAWDIEITEVRLGAGNNGVAALEGYDLYIFEGEMPNQLPTDGVVLLVDPDSVPNGAGFSMNRNSIVQAPTGYVFDVTAGTPHPITDGVDVTEMRLAAYRQLLSWDNYETLLFFGEDPLLLVKNETYAKIVIMPFSVNDSTMTVQFAFPLLMLNLFNYFFPSAVTDAAGEVSFLFEVGESIQLNARGPELTVTSPSDGSSVVYDELPASFVPTVPGQYDYAQTLISGNVSRGSIYVKIAASESDLTREEASIPSIMIPQTTDDGIAEDLLLYFAIALASLLFLEWLLQVKENY